MAPPNVEAVHQAGPRGAHQDVQDGHADADAQGLLPPGGPEQERQRGRQRQRAPDHGGLSLGQGRQHRAAPEGGGLGGQDPAERAPGAPLGASLEPRGEAHGLLEGLRLGQPRRPQGSDDPHVPFVGEDLQEVGLGGTRRRAPRRPTLHAAARHAATARLRPAARVVGCVAGRAGPVALGGVPQGVVAVGAPLAGPVAGSRWRSGSWWGSVTRASAARIRRRSRRGTECWAWRGGAPLGPAGRYPPGQP